MGRKDTGKEMAPFTTAPHCLQREDIRVRGSWHSPNFSPLGNPGPGRGRSFRKVTQGSLEPRSPAPHLLLSLAVLPPSVNHQSRSGLLPGAWKVNPVNAPAGQRPGRPSRYCLWRVLGLEAWLWLQSLETLLPHRCPCCRETSSEAAPGCHFLFVCLD